MTEATGNSVEAGRSDARRNRGRIIDAARKVFASAGMAAQMQTIANEAGVGLGTVYRHFPTKEDLATEIVKDSFNRMADQIRLVRQNVDDPWQRLVAALRANLVELASDAGARAAMAGSQPVEADRYRDAWGLYRDALAALLAEAHEHGSVRADFLVDDLGMAMCGMSAAMDSLSYVGWERQLAVLLRGIRAR